MHLAALRLHLARGSALDGSGRDRKAIFACATALLLLVAGNVAIHHWGPSNGKQEANRIVSPLDRTQAPPAFVPSEAIKVKRVAHVTVIPEKQHHRQHRWKHCVRTRARTVGAPRMNGKALDVGSWSPKPAEPPMP